MRRWTAAYIAHAQKKHAEGRLRCGARLCRREGLGHYCSIVVPPKGVRPCLRLFYILPELRSICARPARSAFCRPGLAITLEKNVWPLKQKDA